MTLIELKESWAKDSEIDASKLGQSSIATAKLHSKYLNFIIDAKQEQSSAKILLNTVKKLKTRYYRGELTKEELDTHGWEQYQYSKPLKSEMDDILNGDTDVQAAKKELEDIETMIYALESILGQIKSRDFQIKNNIEWNKYISGG